MSENENLFLAIGDEEQANPPAWFTASQGWQVCLRVCPPAQLRKIRKQTAKDRVEYKTVDGIRTRFEYTDLNEEKYGLMLWDYCITDWKGIMDPRTKEAAALTPENKFWAMENSPVFARFVKECIDQLNGDVAAKTEDAEKN